MKNDLRSYGIPYIDDETFMPDVSAELGAGAESEFARILRNLRIKAGAMTDEERTSPDTFACDRVFLEYFVTPEMGDDFVLIARDFLIHEYPNIKGYEMVKYLDANPGECWPDKLFEQHILNAMMNAVNSGSVYTKNLFLYLHKTYYRKEYQMLKRFHTLSAPEVISLGKDERGVVSPVSYARILTISRLYGIEISEECDFLYIGLDYYVKHIGFQPDRKFMDSITDSVKECKKEIEQIFADEDEASDLCWQQEEFLMNVLRAEGFDEEYVSICNDNTPMLYQRLAYTLAILRKTYKNRDFSKEDLMRYAVTFDAVHALISNAFNGDERIRNVLYGELGTDFYDNFPPLFKAEDVMKGRTAADAASGRKTDTIIKANVIKETPKYKEETLIAEIDGLHRRVHQQEGDIKDLREKLAGYRKLSEENERLKEQMEEDRKELIALREQLYSMTDPDSSEKQISAEEMRAYLGEKRVVIIGGHSNWRNKMKEEFPHWVYIEPKASGTLEASVVDKADMVYFFTDTLGHGTYFRYLNVVKEHDVKFGYIHGVNIENNIRKMYKDMR